MSYEPLSEAGQIRVVQIMPGSRFRPISCKLIVANLTDQTLQYDALSYTWGGTHGSKTIVCDDREMKVTKNLYVALRRFRAKDTVVQLWIDQLCINQENVQERNSQVQLMATIYSKAAKVIIWLGEEKENSKNAFQLIRTISAFTQEHPNIVLKEANLESYGLPPWRDNIWLAFGAILHRPWFTRVWVIQEVVMSSNAMVACGSEWISWDILVQAVESVRFAHTSQKFTNRGYIPDHHIIQIDRTRKQLINGTYPKPLALLRLFRRYNATDPRDKYFAFLGLLQYPMSPDYGSSVENVFIGVAEQMIRDPQSLFPKVDNAMMVLYTAGREQQNLRLPSWVPDWSFNAPLMNFFDPSPMRYRAGGGSIIQNKSCVDTRLQLRGKLWDRVKHVGPPPIHLRRTITPYKLHALLRKWLVESSKIVGHCNALYPNGEASIDAYKKILFAQNRGTSQDINAMYWMLVDFVSAPNLRNLLLRREQQTIIVDRYAPRLVSIDGRTFFTTEMGYMGLGPAQLTIGDHICVFYGGNIPVVLRQDEEEFVLLGQAYVHGIMDGEVMLDERLEASIITLR